MARYSKKSTSLKKSGEEAMAIARGTQKPGQTREQTRLVAQGIQKGIELYKKQQAAKKRELDKKLRKVTSHTSDMSTSVEAVATMQPGPASKLAWGLLFLSWFCFGVYFFLSRT
ncbi:FIG00922492: hypothetical protein [hydrothermal vent metagenome]|uniref:DUF2956 domain-containing protein n=1 Tax=hydrothermal vent metagenome TaxID=652676 RepID=A0A3B1B1E6_9ZZZZ